MIAYNHQSLDNLDLQMEAREAFEKKLLSDLERSYEKSAAFTNTFVAEKGL